MMHNFNDTLPNLIKKVFTEGVWVGIYISVAIALVTSIPEPMTIACAVILVIGAAFVIYDMKRLVRSLLA